jgi:hypothetical protein
LISCNLSNLFVALYLYMFPNASLMLE